MLQVRSKNWMQLSSSHALTRGARCPQDLDGGNELQSQGEATGLQPRLRLLQLCSSCPPPAKVPTPVAAGWPGPRANHVPWALPISGVLPRVFLSLAGGRDSGRVGQFWKQVPPAGAVSRGDGVTCREHRLPHGQICFPKQLHLTQKPTPGGASRCLSCTFTFLSLPRATRPLSLN